MRFGERLRQLRQEKSLTLRDLAGEVGVDFTYLSKIENGKLLFGDYPSERLICLMATVLEADPDELLILAEKIPEPIRKRFLERPDAFLKLAAVDDKTLDGLVDQVERRGRKNPR